MMIRVLAATLSVGAALVQLKPQDNVNPVTRDFFAVPDLDLIMGADTFGGSPPKYKDITYKYIGGKPLQLDIHMPENVGLLGDRRSPAMIYLHAGSWLIGSKSTISKHARKLLSEGIAIISVDYRLVSQENDWGGEPVVWPAQGDDLMDAVKWVRENAKPYGIDPWNVGCWGESAGGQLCSWLATAGTVAPATTLQVAVTLFGVNCFLCWEYREHVAGPHPKTWYSDSDWYFGLETNTLRNLMDHRDALTSAEEAAVKLVQSSEAIHNVFTISKNETPPMFLAHGTDDPTVSPEKSELLARALEQFGVTHQLVMAANGKHLYQNWSEEPVEKAIGFAQYYLMQ